MSDPRLTPANARVMADHLPDDSSGRARVRPEPMQITTPLVDLLRAPNGPRDRQLLLGDIVDVYETRADMAFVQARKDGYVGYVPAGSLGDVVAPTHAVVARATHIYPEANFKSAERACLSFGATLHVRAEVDGFADTPHGCVPSQHLRPVGNPLSDPVEVASLFLGTPYLWGGNSGLGIDCSGLVQAACLACGIPCAGDSDQQHHTLGQPLPAGTPFARGDLLFWKGHVAWVASPTTLLHANAHSMSTTYEDIATAIARIEAAGDGPVTAHKRVIPV